MRSWYDPIPNFGPPNTARATVNQRCVGCHYMPLLGEAPHPSFKVSTRADGASKRMLKKARTSDLNSGSVKIFCLPTFTTAYSFEFNSKQVFSQLAWTPCCCVPEAEGLDLPFRTLA